MDLARLNLDLWLLRGVPTCYKEPEMVAALKKLGLRQPDFWYVPGIRKQGQENRGYAFIGFTGPARGAEAQRLTELFAESGRCPWPLRLERSTANVKSMVNNSWIWKDSLASDQMELMPPSQIPWPQRLEPWQSVLLKASSLAGGRPDILAPVHVPPRYSQENHHHPRFSAAPDPAYVSKLDMGRHDDGLRFPFFTGVCLSL
eukprot:TRINITY_DN29225_c0_g1_i1.p1 TRINITY_DN29225_c0_g1~~TRINITY_DN29225_c0_g1_i1.p1  ORF type:complete len:202 (-),score=25.33 TRINITY_DN29225_c0_g1_i1:29-634(-)